jgi:hypothetical protein
MLVSGSSCGNSFREPTPTPLAMCLDDDVRVASPRCELPSFALDAPLREISTASPPATCRQSWDGASLHTFAHVLLFVIPVQELSYDSFEMGWRRR